jgi:hypothetical protein
VVPAVPLVIAQTARSHDVSLDVATGVLAGDQVFCSATEIARGTFGYFVLAGELPAVLFPNR